MEDLMPLVQAGPAGVKDVLARNPVFQRARRRGQQPPTTTITTMERTTMGIIAFIILGLLAGIIAKAILPGSDPGGLIITTIIGIVGALLGGFLAAALFDAHPLDEFFDLSTWITAIVGSIILLAIYRAVMNRSGHQGLSH